MIDITTNETMTYEWSPLGIDEHPMENYTLVEPEVSAFRFFLETAEDLIYYYSPIEHESYISSTEIRIEYFNAVDTLQSYYNTFTADGVVDEGEARSLQAARRVIGEFYKTSTTPLDRFAVGIRNLVKYGDVLGPSFDTLVANGKSFEQIAVSALRTGGADLGISRNDLGVAAA